VIERIRLLALLSLIFLVSCAPRVKLPEPSDIGIAVPEKFESDRTALSGVSFDDAWWKDFGLPEIDDLASKVMEGNFDVKEAEAKVEEMKVLLGVASAEWYPELNLEGKGSRSKIVYRGLGGGDISAIIENYEVDLVPSYELDLWGRKKNTVRASLYEYLSAVEKKRAAVHSVLSDAINLAFEEAFLEQQLELSRKRVETAKALVDAVERRYRAGMSTLNDVLGARRSLHAASAVIPDLERSLDEARRKLSALVGEYPSGKKRGFAGVVNVEDLPVIPPGLPSDLLRRRPDIRAAESAMRAQYERVFQAWKNRFPRITLTGSLGYSSDELRELFSRGNEIWNLALGIASPVFDGGRLKGLQKAEEARFREFIALYAKTVLQAFYEVEVGLTGERELVRKRRLLAREVEEAKRILDLVEDRYKRGLSEFTEILTARNEYYGAKQELLKVDLAILKNRVFIYRALGGVRFGRK